MSSYFLDVELFIDQVKKHPEIWNLNIDDNRFKSKKQRAWAEIARVFIADFDVLPEDEKNDVYKKLHSKWRNIRDSYVRYTKKKDGKRGYMYAKHLSFLSSLYPSTQSASDGEWSDEEPLKKIKRQIILGRSGNESSCQSDPDESEEPSTIENLKRRRKSGKDNIEFVEPYPEQSCSYPMEDEDRSFFESLLPTVREFDRDQKLAFRGDVLRLLQKHRAGITANVKIDPDVDNIL